jgi:hypothetical protein
MAPFTTNRKSPSLTIVSGKARKKIGRTTALSLIRSSNGMTLMAAACLECHASGSQL